MTGEITLSGLVLPVGGIPREKALAARRYGIKTFILPALNEPDLDELPAEIRREMTFVPVETIAQVVKVAIPEDSGKVESGKVEDVGKVEKVEKAAAVSGQFPHVESSR